MAAAVQKRILIGFEDLVAVRLRCIDKACLGESVYWLDAKCASIPKRCPHCKADFKTLGDAEGRREMIEQQMLTLIRQLRIAEPDRASRLILEIGMPDEA